LLIYEILNLQIVHFLHYITYIINYFVLQIILLIIVIFIFVKLNHILYQLIIFVYFI